jgi:hypothetical protein
MSIAIASGVVWLLSTSEAQLPIQMFHMLGYDIAHVPGPPGQARMFNFRAILSSNSLRKNLETEPLSSQ